MAKRTRNYAAEYAREKQLAQEAGFSSARARKNATGWQPFYSSKRDYEKARRQAIAWSNKKSKSPVSKFKTSFSAEQTYIYNVAFVDKKKSHTEFLEALAAYLHQEDPENYPSESDTEFWANY